MNTLVAERPEAVTYARCPLCAAYLETGVKGPRCPTCGELTDLPAPAAPAEPVTTATQQLVDDGQGRCPICLLYTDAGPDGPRCSVHGPLSLLKPHTEEPSVRFPESLPGKGAAPEPSHGMRLMIEEIVAEQNSIAANIAGRIQEALAPLVEKLTSLITVIEAANSKRQ